MNATNVKTTLKSTITGLSSSDLTNQPLDVDRTVAQVATLLATEEANAAQKVKDIAAANALIRSPVK